ncbi:MAG TPA: DUF2807 domain-containing protein, partial [Anaeromyxobacteraceae bacterium]
MRPTPLAAAVLAAACVPSFALAHGWPWSTSGDGEVVAQVRQVAGFDRVKLLAPLDVEVAEGPAHAVEVAIDRNLQPLVETRLEGRTLVIDTRGSIDHRGTGKVTLSLPELRGFAIEGSGDVQIAGADLPRDVELAVAGSGDLRWKGKARRLRVAIEGSGDVRVEGAAEGLEVGVSGSGDVDAQG